MRVGLIPCTRLQLAAEAAASLADCDRVLIEFDVQRVGECRTRNNLIDAVDEECEIRFCDDDDIAYPVDAAIPLGADVLAFGYAVDGRVIAPPADPLGAAVNYVTNGNWLVRRGALEFVRAKFGHVYDPGWVMNSGTRIWLRMIDAGLKFSFAPGKIGYHWRRGLVPGSPSSKPKRDPALYTDLAARGLNVGERVAWDQGGSNA